MNYNISTVFKTNLFDDKYAIVTGGGSGIGFRIAKELVYLGCTVFICARKLERLKTAADNLNDFYNLHFNKDNPENKIIKAYAIQMNVRDETSRLDGINEISEISNGKIDYLVNNAGGQFPSPASNIKEKGWKAVIDLNLNALFLITKLVFNRFFVRQNNGVVVNIIANMWNGFPGMSHTGAARSAVDNLTKTLAVEWSSYGVRVLSVAPGTINSSGLLSYDDAFQSVVFDNIKNNYTYRHGTMAEVAGAVVYLLSPAAAYITGETLRVDGGESIYSPITPPIKHESIKPWDDDKTENNNGTNKITSKL
eukprot:TRINITY_DN367_c0_g1_i1.p1 TRINITY_DN367_c0_g1~~TRINITY_DN367_c0_g1_i1.p1  ORF type:complete len:309 (-),score=85.48 TRINITY_DN367_c0_g1_i1:117-1043(-)